MKSKLKFVARASLASCLSFAAFAAQKPHTAAEISNAEWAQRSAAGHPDPMTGLGVPLKASDLIGMKIEYENDDRQKTGRVNDLAVDLQAGRVVHVIISVGGFLSVGDREIAVPPGRLHYRAAGKPLHFEVTAEGLKSAPTFGHSGWKDYYESDRVQESYRHFGDEAPFSAMSERDTLGANPARRNGLGHVQKATKLIGLAVRNLQDEKIGSVDNLIIDLPAGRVVAVIVSTGGFLGLGDTLSAIPPTALRFTDDHNRLRLDTTKETLTNAPRFKAGEWPDFAQPDYAAGIYRAYDQKPYFAGNRDKSPDADNSAQSARYRGDRDKSPDADNSVQNVRDRGDRTLTAADQGGNTADVKLTQQIRKDVSAADGFSVNAKNVKIITVGGRVTLRGPVKTAEEKAQIAGISVRVAGTGNVDDQLEITAR